MKFLAIFGLMVGLVLAVLLSLNFDFPRVGILNKQTIKVNLNEEFSLKEGGRAHIASENLGLKLQLISYEPCSENCKEGETGARIELVKDTQKKIWFLAPTAGNNLTVIFGYQVSLISVKKDSASFKINAGED